VSASAKVCCDAYPACSRDALSWVLPAGRGRVDLHKAWFLDATRYGGRIEAGS